ncbi:hypothetical protein [Terrihabitans sp. B22-R8]|uniref:hypothetical protein n=1 Tax=Terrihabitans sp. B22-R8 TaxID=3425128 RepID=UPI00403CE4A9
MKNRIAAMGVLPFLLTACGGPDEIVSDLPSPNGAYHVEVRKCPQKGAPLERTEITQVSVLEAGKSEPCHSAVDALMQFDGYAHDGQLDLEWTSDTELRVWHPAFNPDYGPNQKTARQDSPVKVSFAPKS